jgi:hypothetical protein
VDIEKLGREAIRIIKNKWGLPQIGILAGGSIGNIIWELVSGNKAVINDIDIFILNKKIDDINADNLYLYTKNDIRYTDDYRGIGYVNSIKEYYSIISTDSDGIFNNISFESNVDDPMIIINSFDINSTTICYSIDNDKLYWTNDFEQFLNTGRLKITNLRTPSHTAVRLVKKSNELNCFVDKFEFRLLQHTIKYGFTDIIRWKFMSRYKEMWDTYEPILKEYFSVLRDNVIDNFYRLYIEDKHIINDNIFNMSRTGIFNDENLNTISNGDQFLFYMRNIYNKKTLYSLLWKKLSFFYDKPDYIDIDSLDMYIEDIDFLSKLINNFPSVINNLKKYKLSEQIVIIRKILDIFKGDPIIAVSLLSKEGFNLNNLDNLDETTILLMELSVRKSIVDESIIGKVSRLFNEETPVDNLSSLEIALK